MYPDVRGSPTGWSTQTGTGSGVRESQSGCFLYRCASLQQGTRRSRDHQNRDSMLKYVTRKSSPLLTVLLLEAQRHGGCHAVIRNRIFDMP
jgi:hypothetical protein